MSKTPTKTKPTYRANLKLLRNLPEHIRTYEYFCLWRWEWNEDDERWTKMPYDPSRPEYHARVNDKTTFAPLDKTLEAYEACGVFDGVGLGLFDGRDGVDVDHRLDADGCPDDFCAGIIEAMDSYTEISPSGDGVHILFTAQEFTAEIDGEFWKTHYKKNPNNGVECYIAGHTNRFLTITGDKVLDGSIGDKSTQVRQLFDQHMKRRPKPKNTTTSTTAARPIDIDDDELISKAKASKNGGKFSSLWDGITSGYGSVSEADQALCNMLAFWTGKDAERMDRLFRSSGLYREKWDEMRGAQTYGQMTISKAIEDTTATYDPKRKRPGYSEILELNQIISDNDEWFDWDGNPVERDGGECEGHEDHAEGGEADSKPEAIVADSKPGESDADEPYTRVVKIKPSQITDMGLAGMFAQSVPSVKYVSELKSFVTYDGKKWDVNGGDRLAERKVKDFIVILKRLVGTRLAQLAGVDVKQDTPEAREVKDMQAIYSLLCDYSAQNRRAHLVRDIQSERGILCTSEVFDRVPHMLNCENGTLDLGGDSPVFKDHDPNDFITRIAPVAYDPKAECPLFLNTINDVLEGDVELITFVQKWFGIIVAGITENEKFLVLGLKNRAGKNTLMHPLFVLLGGQMKNDRSAYAVNVEPATIAEASVMNSHGPSSDLARLQGKRLMLTSEVKEEMRLNCDLMKRITDREVPISARRMRENEVSFLTDGILVMLCNIYPVVNDKTLFDGDRPVCVPFNRRYEEWERDKTLKKRLREPNELSGVLNWAIEGLARYRAEGLDPIPDQVREMGAEFRANCDPLTTTVEGFLRTHLEHADGEMTTVEEAYQSYANETVGTPMSRDEFRSRVGMFVRVIKRKRDARTGAYRRNVIPDVRLA